jgi:hypothetical protein
MHLHTGNFLFSGQLVEKSSFRVDEWEANLAQQIGTLWKKGDLHVYHIAKDIPLLYLLAFPRLAAFKHHFWQRCVLQCEEYHNRKFSISGSMAQIAAPYSDLAKAYALIPSTEVWSPNVLSALLMQIDFYRNAELFESDRDSALLYTELEALVNHTQLQAEYGHKFAYGMQNPGKGPAFNLYVNEIQTGDETLVATSSQGVVSFVSHTFFNYLYTYDERFGEYLLMMAKRVIGRSTPISFSGEKERNVFFEGLLRAINKARHSPTQSPMHML